MEPNVLIALITGGATVIVASIGAGVSIYSLISQGTRLKTIEQHTDGLLSAEKARTIAVTEKAEAVAVGVAEGTAAGVAAGAKAEQERVK